MLHGEREYLPVFDWLRQRERLDDAFHLIGVLQQRAKIVRLGSWPVVHFFCLAARLLGGHALQLVKCLLIRIVGTARRGIFHDFCALLDRHSQ